jgi:hypothetical protein
MLICASAFFDHQGYVHLYEFIIIFKGYYVAALEHGDGSACLRFHLQNFATTLKSSFDATFSS